MSETPLSPWTCALVDEKSLPEVLPLMAAYQRFYECPVNEEKNRDYFAKLIKDPAVCAMFVARATVDGIARGFATLYFVPSSLSAETSCTFNDLYTVPGTADAAQGVELALFAMKYARERGFKKMNWLTSPTNKVAQRIYEWANGKRSEWIYYDVSLE